MSIYHTRSTTVYCNYGKRKREKYYTKIVFNFPKLKFDKCFQSESVSLVRAAGGIYDFGNFEQV
jgi:hypothetical protein